MLANVTELSAVDDGVGESIAGSCRVLCSGVSSDRTCGVRRLPEVGDRRHGVDFPMVAIAVVDECVLSLCLYTRMNFDIEPQRTPI